MRRDLRLISLVVALQVNLLLRSLACAADRPWEDVSPRLTTRVDMLQADPHRPGVMHIAIAGWNDASNPIDVWYKSYDWGSTWQPVDAVFRSPETGRAMGGPSLLVFAPDRPTVVHAVVWEAVFRSVDGGLNWDPVFAGGINHQLSARDVVHLGGDASRLLAASGEGLFESDDSGATWTQVGDASARMVNAKLAPSPIEPSIVYGLSGRPADRPLGYQVMRSRDGGHHWEELDLYIDDPSDRVLAVSPSTTGVVFVGTGTRLLRSADYGESWTPVIAQPNDRPLSMTFGAPAHGAQAYVGTATGLVLVSADGGDAWQPLGRYRGSLTATHLVVAPDDDTVYFANSQWEWGGSGLGDVRRYSPTSQRWTQQISGLPNSAVPIDSVSVGRANPNVVYAASRDLGVFRSLDGSRSWEWVWRSGGVLDVPTRLMVQTVGASDVVFALLGRNLSRLADDGEAGELFVAKDESPGEIAGSSQDESDLYMEGGLGLRRTRDRGKSWTLINRRVGGALFVDPSDANRLTVLDYGGKALKSGDGGLTFTKYVVGRPPQVETVRLAVSPLDPRRMLVGYQVSGISYSIDGGVSWAKSRGPSDVVDLVVSPQDASLAFASSHDAVWRSTDGGCSFQSIAETPVSAQLAIQPGAEAVLFVALGQAGLMRQAQELPLPSPVCRGDCSGDMQVTVDEVVILVSVALGQRGICDCLAGDSSGDRLITVEEIVGAIHRALEGCSSSTR